MFFIGARLWLIYIRLAEEKDIPQIRRIADADRKWLGFVSRAWVGGSIAKQELSVAVMKDKMVGFIRYHKRQDEVVTIYEICVANDSRRRGLGLQLIFSIGDHYLRLKCYQDNPACDFYRKIGFEITGTFISKGGKEMYVFERNNIPF